MQIRQASTVYIKEGDSMMISLSNKKRVTVMKTVTLYSFGAEEKTRTSTGMPPLDPEPSASTNSATSACDNGRDNA